jgi:hypothetical protein
MSARYVCAGACLILFLCSALPAAAASPVKWSAPLSHYPNPWTPTTPPPSMNNPYGYNYPYAQYGYGPYGQAYQGGQQNYTGAWPQGGHFGQGNPYYNYYTE